MADATVQVNIQTRADAAPIKAYDQALEELNQGLAVARQAMANAAPGTEQYMAAVAAVGSYAGKISEILTPLRAQAEAQAQTAAATENVNAMLRAGINPWTTASAQYRAAQAALESEAAAARQAAVEHERLNRVKQAQFRDQKADAMVAAQRQMAADLREAEQSTARLALASKKVNDEHERTPVVAGASSTSTRNAGMSMLIFSQALEDAQYGLNGILNNIPGLVLALGGGPGLAGVISVAAVGLLQLKRLVGDVDLEGTWIDEVKKQLVELVTGASEAEKKMKSVIESPVSWSRSGVEGLAAYKSKMEEVLQAEITLLRERNDVMVKGNQLRLDAMAHEERMYQIQHPNADNPEFKGTEEWAQQETNNNKSKFNEREIGRVKELDAARDKERLAKEEAQKAQDEADAAADREAAVKQREIKGRQDAELGVQNIDAQKRIRELDQGIGKEGRITPEMQAESDRLKKEIEARDAQRAELQKQMQGLPGLRDGETSKDVEDEAARKRQEAAEAQAKARQAERERQVQGERYKQGNAEDRAQFEQDQKQIDREVFDKTSRDFQKSLERKEIQEPEPTPLPQKPLSPQEKLQIDPEVTAAAKKLEDWAQGTGNQQAKNDLEEKRRTLLDGQGDTEGELKAIQEMIQKIEEGKTSASEAMRQATEAMRNLSAENAQTSQRMANTVAGLLEISKTNNSQWSALQSEVESVKAGMRTMMS